MSAVSLAEYDEGLFMFGWTSNPSILWVSHSSMFSLLIEHISTRVLTIVDRPMHRRSAHRWRIHSDLPERGQLLD